MKGRLLKLTLSKVLQAFVFPFFVQKLEIDDPRKWPPEYHRWEAHLSEYVKSPVTRNHIRTALRRYLRFLEKHLGYPALDKPTNEIFRREHREGKVLPEGRLPSYAEALTWLRRLPSGRARWAITLCVAFGVRISEALAITRTDMVPSGPVGSASMTCEKLHGAGDFSPSFHSFGQDLFKCSSTSHGTGLSPKSVSISYSVETAPHSTGTISSIVGSMVLQGETNSVDMICDMDMNLLNTWND